MDYSRDARFVSIGLRSNWTKPIRTNLNRTLRRPTVRNQIRSGKPWHYFVREQFEFVNDLIFLQVPLADLEMDFIES
jgi:hypothetical protein